MCAPSELKKNNWTWTKPGKSEKVFFNSRVAQLVMSRELLTLVLNFDLLFFGYFGQVFLTKYKINTVNLSLLRKPQFWSFSTKPSNLVTYFQPPSPQIAISIWGIYDFPNIFQIFSSLQNFHGCNTTIKTEKYIAIWKIEKI